MSDVAYDLGDRVQAYEAFGVYWKSDEIYIPSSRYFCYCATEQLAEKVATLLQRAKDKKINYENRSYFVTAPLMQDKKGAFSVDTALCSASKIARSISQALQQLESHI